MFQSSKKAREVEKVWYIGDSKYYRLTQDSSDGGPSSSGPYVKDFGAKSYIKQFTYAKNVIQEMVNRINEPKRKGKREDDCGVDPANYRDEETEGYAVTPNFFVSGIVKERYTLEEHKFELVKLKPEDQRKMESCHFPDRLFDRDTLLLQQYNISFLYVLASYVGAPGVQSVKAFRDYAYGRIRTNALRMLCERYHFLRISVQNDPARKWALRGKVFPCSCGNWLLALRKKNKDDEEPECPKELKAFWSEVKRCVTPCPRLCFDKNELIRCDSPTK